MPLSTALKDAVDLEISDLQTQLTTKQADYLAANGKYWQGIAWTPSIPQDGATVATDATVSPTDQTADWTDAGITVPANAKGRLEVHAYNGPSGKGYVIVATVKETDTSVTPNVVRKYSRSVGVGPESRDFAWAEVIEEI